jgi:hypothetical protein
MSRPRDQPFACDFALARPLQFREVLTQERQTRNMKTISNAGLKVKAGVKAGGIGVQHNRPGLRIKAAVKAGGIGVQHNRPGLRIKAAVKAGGIGVQHNRPGLRIKAAVKAGFNCVRNHNRRLLTA